MIKSSPLPIYYQLEEQIKKQIESGELQPGDMLPSEREYAELINVSRMTVRQAMNNLVDGGYLYRQKKEEVRLSLKKSGTRAWQFNEFHRRYESKRASTK
ncbi:hypothetical protein GCM10020331_083250 [Ectobacillus funiculus]